MISYRQIELTKGKVALVDQDMFDKLSQFAYYAKKTRNAGVFYAARYMGGGRENAVQTYMHREVIGLAPGDKRLVDHINGDTLDNRRDDLRVASVSQNAANGKRQINNKSGYKGVCRGRPGRWRASIMINRKYIHLGTYSSPELAHSAYCEAARRLYGEFANSGDK